VYSKHRLEALSDAIFAIVMTLLILDIKVPTGIPHGQLAHALAEPFRDWIALVITFAISARFWVLQHQLFDLLEQIKPRTLATTFIFLGLITMLPFTTALWGHNLAEPLAFCLYFAHQFLIGAAMLVEIESGLRDHNLHIVEAMYKLRGRLYIMLIVMGIASITTWLLPLQYTGLLVAVISGISRRILKFFEKRRARKHAHT
jgi:TMEM175 potassium channel family protein